MKNQKIIGCHIAHLYVIDRVPNIRKHSPRYLCFCECGKVLEIDGRHLISGATKSCGCKNRETLKKIATTHGKTKTTEYAIWRGMRYRCLSESCKEYKHYGGRGIAVCEAWANSFEAFLKDMGPRPKGASIERLNNDGNYEPSNCKWADKAEQSRNKRSNVFIEIEGVRLTQSEWAKKNNIPVQVIYTRIKRGWGTEDAVTVKTGHPRNLQAPPL